MEFDVFNFTNKELEELAVEFIQQKLKREFYIVDRKSTKRRELKSMELDLKVEDLSARQYNFKFWFSEYFFDCCAGGGISKIEVKECSNQSMSMMKLILKHYVAKAGLEYVDKFKEYHINRIDKELVMLKNEAKNPEVIKNLEKECSKQKEIIAELCQDAVKTTTANV